MGLPSPVLDESAIAPTLHDDARQWNCACDQSFGGDCASHDASADDTHSIEWPDLNRIELWCLLPLAVLTIVFGVYPKPILDIVGPAFERILLPFMS